MTRQTAVIERVHPSSFRTANEHGRSAGRPREAPRSPEVVALGRHRIVCGDPADRLVLARLLGTEIVDLVIGEPPEDGGDIRQRIGEILQAVEPRAGRTATAILHAPLRRLVALVRAGASHLVDPARGRTLPCLPAVALLVHAHDSLGRELEEALAGCTPEGAIVLDPFATDAAVLVAAEATGRSARLVCSDLETAAIIADAWKTRGDSGSATPGVA